MRGQRGVAIGKHFYAGTCAAILGSLFIEDNVTVGDNTVVTKSTSKDAAVAGVPAWLTYQTDTARAERQPTKRRKA
jgi:serine acetyltransferase